MNSGLSQSPLFIIGSPRSGTSLLRLIMTSHSQVVIPPECGFIVWLQSKYGHWRIEDNNKDISIESFVNDLFDCKKMDTWEINKVDVRERVINCQPENYAELCATICSVYADSFKMDFKIWGDKNNFYLNHLDQLLDLYGDARFLHIVRDGRDIACSYRKVMSRKADSPYAPKLQTDIYDIAKEWSSNVMKVDSFMALLPADRAMTVKYEDLVTAPSNTIMSVCEWLSIPFESNMMNFYQENKNKKLEPELTLDWKRRTLEPISDATVGIYVGVLSKEEQDEFLKTADSMLQKFSYT